MAIASSCIIVPARYASTRLPAKPLCMIAGKTMLERVVAVAKRAAKSESDPRQGKDRAEVIVAVDHPEVFAYAETLGVTVVMTDPALASGTDRCWAAVQSLPQLPDIILNFQGDAPLIPWWILSAMLDALEGARAQGGAAPFVLTPVDPLSWEELDQLRATKAQSPTSGATAICREDGRAVWFSKQIIPNLRQEDRTRPLSPILRHLGLYGFHSAALAQYVTLPPSYYEQLEGLEQLRLLENDIPIQTIRVAYHGVPKMSGVDTEHDRQMAEQLILTHGEFMLAAPPSHR